MPTLHDTGWRQGSILHAALPLVGLILNESGQVVTDSRIHEQWIIATQDCDLVQCEVTSEDDNVELRPIFTDSPPSTRGIRSRKFLLGGNQYLESASRRMMISPLVLSSLLDAGAIRDNNAADDISRRSEYKTWLGYRYDRPAVPEEYVTLIRSIADAIERHNGKQYTDKVRDILVQFEPNEPPIFDVFAVIMNENDTEDIEGWLAGAVMGISVELGVLGSVNAATADDTPLSLIESSFAADLSRITWTNKGLRGQPGRYTRPLE